MKKSLLTMLLLVVGMTMATAAEVGSYIFTPTDRYKVAGENVVQNGNFSASLDGWTNDLGESVNGELWSVENELGPNGEAVLMSGGTHATDVTNYVIANKWQGLSGMYAVSYWVKAPAAAMTNTGTGLVNYINFFVNSDGSNTVGRAAAKAQPITTEWTQVVDTVTVNAGEWLVLNMADLAKGTLVTNFEIQSVIPVYDIRIAERQVAYVKKLLAEPALAEGSEEILGMLEAVIEPAMADPSQAESADAMNALLDEFSLAFNEFLESKAANTVGIYLGDWSKQGFINWNNMTTQISNWNFFGGRWGFSPNSEQLERPAGDGYVASAGIQTTMNLSAVGVRAENALLPPGKYLFAIDAQAVSASNKAQPYGADYSVEWKGPSIFVGKDTLLLEDEVLSGYHWNRYYHIFDVAEGDTVRAGFIFPVHDDKKGGRASLRNPELRVFGQTADNLSYLLRVHDVIAQQDELKNRLDNYMNDVADMKWEKDSLQRAIDAATPIYEYSLTVIDANHQVLMPEGVTQELVDDLLAQVNAMGRAKNWVVNSNAVIDNLKAAIETATAILNDEINATASAATRKALADAIAEGQALINGITEGPGQMDEFNASIAKIQEAQVAFTKSTANYNNPSPEPIINPDFDIYGKTTKMPAGLKDGWNYTYHADVRANQDMKNELRGTVEGEKWAMGTWRGTTVGPSAKVQQTYTVSSPGVYEYRAYAFGTDDTWDQYMGIATTITPEGAEVPNDTIYHPNIRLFVGEVGAPDSVTVTKSYNVAGHHDRYFCSPYAVYYIKTGNEPVELEFGIEAIDNDKAAGANAWGFTLNRLYYNGDDLTQYKADAKAAMQAEIAKAQATISTDGAKLNEMAEALGVPVDEVNYYLPKMQRYINDAASVDADKDIATLKNIQNIVLSLRELQVLETWKMEALEALNSGIEPVSAAPEMEGAKGIYTMGGIRLTGEIKSLKPGLYIINGRKYVVK